MKSLELDGQLQREDRLDLPFQSPIINGNPKHSMLMPYDGFKVIHSKIYISGPVTGIKNDNKEQFQEAETFLCSCGFEVWNPQRVPHPQFTLEPDDLWKWFMHFCVRAIPLCDSMLMLPDWQNSKGAVQEHRIAQMLGLAIYYSPVL